MIFHNPSFRRVKIEAKDVMVPMLVLLGSNVLILALWTALDPLYWDRYVVGYDLFGRPNETRGHCYSDNWLPFLLALAVVNGGALVVAIHQAWIARRISLEFAESEWIARVMNTIFMVAFVGGPVLVIADEDPRAFYFVFTALIFVVSKPPCRSCEFTVHPHLANVSIFPLIVDLHVSPMFHLWP